MSYQTTSTQITPFPSRRGCSISFFFFWSRSTRDTVEKEAATVMPFVFLNKFGQLADKF